MSATGYLSDWQLRRIRQTLWAGGIISYPTEAVYGLGCNPLDTDAVLRLLALKQRPVSKGLILIAHDFATLEPWLEEIPAARRRKILSTWPGPFTWVWPAQPWVPEWLRGEHSTLAVRVTAHPLAARICRAFGGPLVSTSANPASLPPARNPLKIKSYFGNSLDYEVHGPGASLTRPTEIRDALTDRILRPA